MRATAPAAAPGADTLTRREELVRFGEEQITADANRRVAEGTLKGDHKGTSCEIFPETQARQAAERGPRHPARPLRLRRLHVADRGQRG